MVIYNRLLISIECSWGWQETEGATVTVGMASGGGGQVFGLVGVVGALLCPSASDTLSLFVNIIQ